MASKNTWGGKRPGAGRPPGSKNKIQNPNARRNRIAVMVSDAELGRLETQARRRDKPIATVVYDLAMKSLKR